MKKKGDMVLKQKMVQWLIDLLKTSKYLIMGLDWEDPENYSLFLQPLLVSPAINLCDIAVTIYKNPGVFHSDRISELIGLAHPFPVLERFFPLGHQSKSGGDWVVEKNTQVFFDMSQLKGKWTAFSFGSRNCAGRKVAIALISGLFTPLLLPGNLERFRPLLNHAYSGRENDDKIDLAMVLYQATRIAEISLEMVFERLQRSGWVENWTKVE